MKRAIQLNLLALFILFISGLTGCQKEDLAQQDSQKSNLQNTISQIKASSIGYPTPRTTLQHKLTLTGTTTAIDFDASSIISLACRDNMGSAHFRSGWWNTFFDPTSNKYTFDAGAESLLKSLNLPLSRIYYVNYENGGLHKGLDQLAEICSRNNIPQEKTIVCIETVQAKSPLEVLAPSVYKDAISYVKSKGYRFKYWEISNEPQYAWGSGLDDPIKYAKHVVESYDAIKSVDPNMLVGAQINRKSWYSDQVLSNINGKADFIAGHWYGLTSTDKYSTSEVILAENYKNLTYISYENENIKTRTGKVIPQIDSEWRLLGEGTINGVLKDGERNDRCGNIVGTLFQAVRMIYSIRDNYTQGACSWHTQGSQPGVLAPTGTNENGVNVTGKTTYLYWLYNYFIKNTGEQVVDFTGSAPSFTGRTIENVDAGGSPESYTGPLTPLMVTRSLDGTKVFITVVNGSTTATVPFSAKVRNFSISGQTAVRIQDNDVNQPWYQANNSRFLSYPSVTNQSGTIQCSLPPLSVTFITINGSTAAGTTPTPAPAPATNTTSTSTSTSTTATALVNGGTYTFLNRNSSKALDVSGWAMTDNAPVLQWSVTGGANQKWTVVSTSNGYYKIKNLNSGKVLSLSGTNYYSDGVKVTQLTDRNLDSQMWLIAAVDNGYYKIINKQSGKCLDVNNATAKDGELIQQWGYWSGYNQQWKFVK